MSLSLRPSTFTAGGIIDDIDAVISRARFVTFDFNGQSEDKTCLALTLTDNDGTEHIQYWSAGDPQYFVPSVDPKNEDLNGITIVPVGDKKALNGGTNCALLINSLVNAGFPEDKLESGDVRELEGAKVHVNQMPAPKRSNMPTKPGQKQRDNPTILLVTAVLALPGESTTTSKTSAKPGAATTKPGSAVKPGAQATAKSASPSEAAAPDAALVEELGGEIMGLFAQKEVSSMKKAELTKGLFGSIDKTNVNKNKLVAMAGRDNALKALEGFTFDGSTLSIAE